MDLEAVMAYCSILIEEVREGKTEAWGVKCEAVLITERLNHAEKPPPV